MKVSFIDRPSDEELILIGCICINVDDINEKNVHNHVKKLMIKANVRTKYFYYSPLVDELAKIEAENTRHLLLKACSANSYKTPSERLFRDKISIVSDEISRQWKIKDEHAQLVRKEFVRFWCNDCLRRFYEYGGKFSPRDFSVNNKH